LGILCIVKVGARVEGMGGYRVDVRAGQAWLAGSSRVHGCGSGSGVVSRPEEHPSIDGKGWIVEVQVKGYGWRRHGRQLVVRRVEWHPNIKGEDRIVEVQVRVSS
jgi:hypothetical protein